MRASEVSKHDYLTARHTGSRYNNVAKGRATSIEISREKKKTQAILSIIDLRCMHGVCICADVLRESFANTVERMKVRVRLARVTQAR